MMYQNIPYFGPPVLRNSKSESFEILLAPSPSNCLSNDVFVYLLKGKNSENSIICQQCLAPPGGRVGLCDIYATSDLHPMMQADLDPIAGCICMADTPPIFFVFFFFLFYFVLFFLNGHMLFLAFFTSPYFFFFKR